MAETVAEREVLKAEKDCMLLGRGGGRELINGFPFVVSEQLDKELPEIISLAKASTRGLLLADYNF